MIQSQPGQGLFQSRIPEFSSYEEEAEFWDTHDFTDFLDELTLVEVRPSASPSESITIHLDVETWAALQEQAKQKNLKPDTLVKSWILEHVQGHG